MIGFSFKGRHSSTLDIGVRSVDRTLIPQKRKNDIIIPGRHGSMVPGEEVYDRRYIKMIIGLINNEDWIDLRTNSREIAEWLSGEGKLIFDDEPDKYYMARVYDAVGLEQMHLQPIGGAEITFDCQPFAYMVVDTITDDTWDEADYPWLISIPWDNSVTYTHNFATTGIKAFTFVFDNPGTQMLDYKAPEGSKSIIKITGNWSALGIDLNDKNLGYPSSGNGTLLIDNVEMEFTVNGINRLAYLNGDIDSFLPIKKGSNVIRVSCIEANIQVSLDFRPMWI